MVQKLKAFINKMNQYGIPLPLLRDPKSGMSSVSLTMMAISFVICSVGLVGKFAGPLDGINLGEALTLFGVCASLYFGRNLSVASKGDTTVVQGDDK
jgi:hypothetical protein